MDKLLLLVLEPFYVPKQFQTRTTRILVDSLAPPNWANDHSLRVQNLRTEWSLLPDFWASYLMDTRRFCVCARKYDHRHQFLYGFLWTRPRPASFSLSAALIEQTKAFNYLFIGPLLATAFTGWLAGAMPELVNLFQLERERVGLFWPKRNAISFIFTLSFLFNQIHTQITNHHFVCILRENGI